MVGLIVGDQKTTIIGASKEVIKLLDARTSYRVEGFQFSPQFKQRRWDGKTHLLRYSNRYGLRLYSGLAPIADRWLRNNGHEVEVEDVRRPFDRTADLPWESDIVLRDDQVEAVNILTDESKVLAGRGMLSSAVRSGKTVIAAGLTHATQGRTLFLVNQDLQFTQTVDLFNSIFGARNVGGVGRGKYEFDRPVTVAMVQTLHPRRKTAEVKNLLRSVDILFIDECLAKGTRVRYSDGTSKRIEDVRVGDHVATPLGPRKVTRVIPQGKRVVDEIKTRSGAVLRPTPNHPLAFAGGCDAHRISEGWHQAVQARDHQGDLLRLWKADHEQECGGTQDQLRGQSRSSSADARAESDVRSRSAKTSNSQGAGVDEDGEAATLRRSEMGERQGCDSKRKAGAEAPSADGIRGRVQHRNRQEKMGQGQRRAVALHGGPCASRTQDRCRVGRGEPCQEGSPSLGREEGSLPGEARLDRGPSSGVEDGDIRALRAAQDDPRTDTDPITSYEEAVATVAVYDLEVEEVNCFYANDILVHNCHHLKSADTWKKLVLGCDARYKIGLSATIYLSQKDDAANAKGAIWLQALTGPLRHTISTKRLTKAGILVPVSVYLVKVNGPDVPSTEWPECHDEGIVHHPQRNRIIARIARQRINRGRRTLVIAHRHQHIDNLIAEFEKHGLGDEYVRVDGKVTGERRDSRVRQFAEGKKPLLIGSVFREAVDIPEIEDVIVAEGGKDRKSAIQRMRNLTPHAGKAKRVRLYDLMDLHNPILAAHSRARLEAYKAENCFTFKVLDWGNWKK